MTELYPSTNSSSCGKLNEGGKQESSFLPVAYRLQSTLHINTEKILVEDRPHLTLLWSPLSSFGCPWAHHVHPTKEEVKLLLSEEN